MSTHELSLPSGHVAVVDFSDRELVGQHRWRALIHKGNAVYVQAHFGSKELLLHRLIMDAQAGVQVDHRDGDGLNNRRSNLRLASPSQNQGNGQPRINNKSGYKGVSWHTRRRRWRASIWLNGRQRDLGYFADPWDAAQAYNAAALEQWGEFARLNMRRTDN